MTTQNKGHHRHVPVGTFHVGNDLPLALIAGPCMLESASHAMAMAEALTDLARARSMPLIYKTSFDKANRTSASSPRGVGLKEGLAILADVKKRFGCPLLTDVHEISQCQAAAEVVDVLQIPAFLCRQTDLVHAAALTGRPLHIKKGQFLAPWDMKYVLNKAVAAGNDHVMVGERGVSFGYNTLVSDMRSLPILAATGHPVVFDATHSVQQPGGEGGRSGGQRQFVPVLARAAVAIGVAAVFLETHEDPDRAPSDGPNMVHLKDMPNLLDDLQTLDRFAKSRPLSLEL